MSRWLLRRNKSLQEKLHDVPQEPYWGTQAELAKEAELGITTIADCELERRQTSFSSLGAIREPPERSGVQFTFGKRPGVKLRRLQR